MNMDTSGEVADLMDCAMDSVNFLLSTLDGCCAGDARSGTPAAWTRLPSPRAGLPLKKRGPTAPPFYG